MINENTKYSLVLSGLMIDSYVKDSSCIIISLILSTIFNNFPPK